MAGFKKYKKEGQEYTRVSTILDQISKPGLYWFYVKVACEFFIKLCFSGERLIDTPECIKGLVGKVMQEAKKVSKKATDIGTSVHNYAYDYFSDEEEKSLFDVKDLKKKEIANAIDNFHFFVDLYHLEPIELEKTVYCEDPNYAGTFDGLFKYGNKVILLDWKTSKDVYDPYILQLHAYTYALRLEGIEVDEVWAVRLAKEGEFSPKKDVVVLPVLKELEETFLNLARTYYGMKKIKEFRKFYK